MKNPSVTRPSFNKTHLLILTLTIIVGLSFSTWSLYSGSQQLNAELESKQRQINDLTTSLTNIQSSQIANLTSLVHQQSLEIEQLRSSLQTYAKLFDSNIVPPVTKMEAVGRALAYNGWNSTRLNGMVVEAKLAYVSMFSGEWLGSSSFEYLETVTHPVDYYAPRVEHNVTVPGSPMDVGTMTYRYVWYIVVEEASGIRGIPPPGLYLVDASDGTVFKNDVSGFNVVPSTLPRPASPQLLENLKKISNDTWVRQQLATRFPDYPVVSYLGNVSDTSEELLRRVSPNFGRVVEFVSGEHPEYFRMFTVSQREVGGQEDPTNHWHLGFITSYLVIYDLGIDTGLQ